MGDGLSGIGVVAIGRNEGERLVRCLESTVADGRPTVYVDSGSTDGSADAARGLGAEVVDLDLSIPFTAARARNAGWRRLLELDPELQAVLFLDGDCELAPGFLAAAAAVLAEEPSLAVACGRRRERHPEASLFNRLCDLEWDTPVGLAESCGGDALIRVEALRSVDGYDDSAIAGEEPEMCFRLRGQGWKVRRIDAEMTLHDAAMTRVGQWWQRSRRAGHAFASNLRRHREAGFKRAEVRRAVLWGLVLPVVLLGGALFAPWTLLALLVYPLQAMRIARRLRHQRPGTGWGLAVAYGFACMVGKFAEAVGVVGEARRHRRGEVALIEYK